MDNKKDSIFEDYSEITSEGSLNAFQASRIYHTHHHLPPPGFKTHQSEPEKPVISETAVEKQNKRHFKFRHVMLLLLSISLLGLFIGLGTELTKTFIFNLAPEVQVKYTPEIFQRTNSDSSSELSVVDIAHHLKPSLVAITNEKIQETFFGQTRGQSAGSGVIFDISTKKIYILTNNHVVDGANRLKVSFFGDHTYDSTVVGIDQDTDLAVITVEIASIDDETLGQLKPVAIGNSDAIEVGETAVAMGNPLGYNNTVTVGVISALNRIISNDLNALSLIQTDAAINPGNSGGALVNIKGQLIGINTIKISDTSVEGIGFAIPINSALPILEEIIEKGYVSKPFIGIYGQDVTEDMATMYSIPQGVVVNDFVPDGPASDSQLKIFDIIIALEKRPIKSMKDLTQALSTYKIGDIIEVTVMREVEKSFEKFVIEIEIADRNK
jgi:serine protease Do